jgi:hypothetical protein
VGRQHFADEKKVTNKQRLFVTFFYPDKKKVTIADEKKGDNLRTKKKVTICKKLRLYSRIFVENFFSAILGLPL